jgi:PadR family transcriptional regulator, regulatory protein PadR
MAGIERVTRQLLAVLVVLLEAYVQREDLHGYEMMKRAGLSGASTYRNLDRLEDERLVEARWEELSDGQDRPRRRYYRLNPAGAAFARKTLSERKPEVLERLGRRPRSPEPRRGVIMPFPGPSQAWGVRSEP